MASNENKNKIMRSRDQEDSMEPKSSEETSDQEIQKSDQEGSWDLLPDHIWETILSLLPISTLFRTKSLSKKFLSIIQSPSFLSAYEKVHHRGLYFCLFPDLDYPNAAAAYNPAEDKWVTIPLSFISPSFMGVRYPLVSGGAFVLAENREGSMIVCNLFTRKCRIIPPMIPAINHQKKKLIPAMICQPYVLGLIDLSSSFKIVAVSTADRVCSKMYNSETNSWKETGTYPGRFAMLGNSVYLNGFLFCLSHQPDSLLYFELVSGTWGHVDVTVPSLVGPHILAHNNTLFLVGGVKEIGMMKKIGIWELDGIKRVWKLSCFMPDHLFDKFWNKNWNYFNVVDRQGKICFCRRGYFLIYDLLENRWWWLPPLPFGNAFRRIQWFGHAVEPRIDELL